MRKLFIVAIAVVILALTTAGGGGCGNEVPVSPGPGNGGGGEGSYIIRTTWLVNGPEQQRHITWVWNFYGRLVESHGDLGQQARRESGDLTVGVIQGGTHFWHVQRASIVSITISEDKPFGFISCQILDHNGRNLDYIHTNGKPSAVTCEWPQKRA